MDEWAELHRLIAAMAGSDNTEIREDGEWLAGFDASHCELRRQGEHSLLHLWSDGRNLTRRVLRVKEQSENRLVLEVQRFGRARPGHIEFVRKDTSRPTGRISREEFRSRVRRVLSESFPDAQIGSLTASPDLEHSFSGLYVRGQMREGNSAWALLAIPPRESAASIDGSLVFGLLWLDWCRNRSGHHAIEGLRLFAPEGGTRRLRERTLALSSAARTEIFEFREREERMYPVDAADVGNLESCLVPRSEMESILASARQSSMPFPALASRTPGLCDAIVQRVLPGRREASFTFRGLEFARWSPEGLSFGIGDSRRPLTHAAEPALERLIGRMDLHRSPLATETTHPLYRKAPERWLETIILEDPSKLEAQLDPRHLYSQVPALVAGDRGVLDLLGVTRRGRLVVIELKTSEDIQLPMQAVDYWLRVRRHQREGDFQRYGYFTNIELDPKPPLIWLVAPGLRFHSAIGTLQRYVRPEIQITRIGLNENWRRGVDVIFRR